MIKYQFRWKIYRNRILLIIGIFVIGWIINDSLSDGIRGMVFQAIFGPGDTVYASQYSEKAFRQVRVGDSYETVIQLIGEPLEKGRLNEIDRWWYSCSPSSTHYRMREVCFRDGKVIEKIHYYYVD